jgi:hypothetical protein
VSSPPHTAARPAPGPVTGAHCPGRATAVHRKRLDRNHRVCPERRHHLRLSATDRLALLLDENSPTTVGDDLTADDPPAPRAPGELRAEAPGVRTTIPFHRRVPAHPVFRTGEHTTAFPDTGLRRQDTPRER